MNKSARTLLSENSIASARISFPANRLVGSPFSHARKQRKRNSSLLWAVSLLALACGNTATAADSDNDGIDNVTEGQFNGGVAQPLFNNRSFERPDIGSGYDIVDIANVPGWSTDSHCNCAEIWFNGYNGVNSYGGNQFVELNAVSASDLHQQITVPADAFTVTWSIAHRGRNAVDTMEIYLGVDASTKVLADTVSTGTGAWSVYQGTWNKPAGATSLYIELQAVGSGSIGNFIDELQVNAVSLDTDSDGTPDYLDNDSDADGVPDQIETTVDKDTDGIPDFQDGDSTGAATDDNDNDGLSNHTEISTTLTDPANPDSDDDGLTDGDEVNVFNTDPNNPDTDGGGTTDGDEVESSTNPVDDPSDDALDSDKDGLNDEQEVEAGTDPSNPDTDADGLTDGEEIANDTDPNAADSDSDGLTDGAEVSTHGTNPLQADTDSDGLSDSDEVNTTFTDPVLADSDGDTLSDGEELNTLGTNPNAADTDGDGLRDDSEISSSETDPLLADTDADGLSDSDELNTYGTDPLNPDSDGGGAPDGDEVLAGSNPALGTDDIVDLDIDNDGIPNSVEGSGDQDADGIANYLDLDSDNDGIPDLVEAGGSDANADGVVDNLTDTNNDGLDDTVAANPLPLPDTDGDGLANFLDTDSDQDGLTDIFEAGGTDSDSNGRVDNFQDADANGLDDTLTAMPLALPDTDNDNTPNYLDLDSDNDGTFDLVEAGGEDSDNDGMVDLFLDDDGDGIPNTADVNSTGGEDTDNDGIDDLADIDTTGGADINNNGIDDTFEADPDTDGRAVVVASDTSTLPDADGDNIPDVLDTPDAAIITGLSGSAAGCAIAAGSNGRVDLFFPMMLMVLGLLLYRRREKQ